MNDMKTMPLTTLIQAIYPDLYAIHDVENTVSNEIGFLVQ